MFCCQQKPFYSFEVISGNLVSMMSLKMYRPLPSCSGIKFFAYIFSFFQRQETTAKVLVFLSRWSWALFRSCEALVLRFVEASPPGSPYSIVSDANKRLNCKLISPLRLCTWFGLKDQKGALPFYASRGLRRFFTTAVLLKVVAVIRPDTVRYDLTWSTGCLLRKTPDLDDRSITAIFDCEKFFHPNHRGWISVI